MGFVVLGAIIFLLGLVIIQLLHYDQLKHFPGPLLARVTNAWKFFDVLATQRSKPTIIELHREYGEVVRTGPNSLSFANPQAVSGIYGADKHYAKSEWYWTAAPTNRGKPAPTLFSALSVEYHDKLRRAIQPAFNLSSVVHYESYVDETVSTLIQELNKWCPDKSGVSEAFDISRWMHFLASDTIGVMTYGAQFGFLTSAGDVTNIQRHTNEFLAYAMAVGQIPWLDRLLLKNPILLWLTRTGFYKTKPNAVVPWALSRQHERLKLAERGDKSTALDHTDLLDKFLSAKSKHPDTFSDGEILAMGITMVLAGSESTGVQLSAFFYFLLKHPSAYKSLRLELDSQFPPTRDAAIVPYAIAQEMPYLNACIKECFRCHPAARFAMDRVLPPSGAVIAGHQIPGGTVVGMNAWALHRRKDVFGEDVEVYCPERWLPFFDEDFQQAKARIAEMNRCLLTFGAGKFSCIGKNITMLEMYKAIPSLLRAFDFELAEPKREWTLGKGTFVNVSGIDVRMRQR